MNREPEVTAFLIGLVAGLVLGLVIGTAFLD
jgi:hypothetical protein